MSISLILKIIGLVALLLLVLAVLPIAFIYSLNTIFGLAVPLELKTWAAAAFLLLVIGLRSK
jgi:hypothetical protein